jgi:hypothetical protein
VTVYALNGSDAIYAGSGSDTFVGGAHDDTIYARSNVEGGGKKTFVWNRGDGNDTVHYYSENHQPGDGMGVLEFGSDIAPEDVEVRNNGANVIFALTDGSVTFVSANTTDVRYNLEEVEFLDGTVWKWEDILKRKVVRGDNYNNTLRASSLGGDNVTVYALNGSDALYAGFGSDTFVGGAHNDTIYARSDVEGGGNKTFVWNIGDGYDTVHYYNETHQPGDGMGILRFGSDVDPNNVTVSNSGGNVVFSYAGGGVTFVGANTTDVHYHVDEIRFADGEVWTWDTMPRQ